MDYQKVAKIATYTSIPLFIVRCLISKPSSPYDIVGAIGEVFFFVGILIYLYVVKIWQYNPLEKTPHFFGKYTGTLRSTYKSGVEKEINVVISQTLFSTKVKLYSNEITSTSLSATIKVEDGDSVLIYTYQTQPKSSVSDVNPIQYGTALLRKEGSGLSGIYWTSRKTTGDIILKTDRSL